MEDAGHSLGQESLYQVVLDLQLSERKYHEQLSYLSDLYILHLKECADRCPDTNHKHRTCVLSGEEVEKMLLTKIKEITELSRSLNAKLKDRLSEWDEENSQIGDIFLNEVHLWDLYRYFCTNIDSALRKYEEKMMCADFAALVSLKQGLDNASLKDLIVLPIQQLKTYRDFFETFLEKTVSYTDFTFSHPDFSNAMECKKTVEAMIPPHFDAIVKRKQVEDYTRLEGMLGALAGEFSSYIRIVHEEPSSAKRWKKHAAKKKMSRAVESDAVHDSSFDIGGKKYGEGEIAPDILNAMQKEEEMQILVGFGAPKNTPKATSPANYYVSSVAKVKVRWEDEDHHYNLVLFRKCLIFAKVRNKSMKIARVIKLRNMWVADYNQSIGFGQQDKTDNLFIGGWLSTEGCMDDQLFHRVIFSFPNKDIRTHWFIQLQRSIRQSLENFHKSAGHIKVYFKGSDSKLSVPSDSIWKGMSCQDIEVDINQTVEQVIEKAVGTCQMIDSCSYSLAFFILQSTTIVLEMNLVDTEMPLVIKNDISTEFADGSNMKVIFVLQEKCGTTPNTPTPHNMSTVVNVLLKVKGGWPGSRARRSSAVTAGPVSVQRSSKMFGAPLSQFMAEGPDTVPAELLDLMVYIYTRCHNSEGIFRVPGSLPQQRAMEKRLEAGESIVWLSEELQDRFYLPNVAASLFKYYLRSVPGGVFPKQLFPEFEEWRARWEKAKEGDEVAAYIVGVSGMQEILNKIPAANVTLIKHTLYILKRIAGLCQVNKMELTTLATCIAPSLIAWPEDASALSILADSYRRQTPSAAVEFFIARVEDLFGAEPEVFQKRMPVDQEDVISRRSRLDQDTSEEEEDKDSIWMMMRSSVKDRGAESSSTGSPVSDRV